MHLQLYQELQLDLIIVYFFQTILIGMGLQYKTADELAAELELPSTQLLGLFNRTMRKISQYLSSVVEQEVAAALESKSGRNLVSFGQPIAQTLSDELDEDAKVSSLNFPCTYVFKCIYSYPNVHHFGHRN